MAKNVISLFDVAENKQHMFAVDEHILLKDAVMAFIEQHAEDFGFAGEPLKDLQTQLSATDSVESLTLALVGFDFLFAMLQVD